MPDRINLVAVQAAPALADYRDADAFSAKIASLVALAAGRADFSLPTLISFPELIGMYLTFVPHYWDDVSTETALERAAGRIVGRHFASVPKPHRTSPKATSRYLLFIRHALEAEAVYTQTFSSLSREHGVYISAGSIALPPIESEPSKGGRHVTDESKVHNVSYLFSPRGVCLARTPKVNMTRGFERRAFDPAPKSELIPVQTPLGRIGTLVCFDAFHQTLVERIDALGAQIILNPSYNMHPWHDTSTYDASRKEGEAWLCTGCPTVIQGRENIRYGVNAMMTGAVFEDTAAEGLSSISVNTGRPDAGWQEGLLAIAQAADGEEIIAACVDHPTIGC